MIDLLPLLVPASLSSGRSGSALYVAETRHIDPNHPGEKDVEYRSATVLLSLFVNERSRELLTPVVNSLSFARSSEILLDQCHWQHQLKHSSSDVVGDSVSAIIVVGDSAVEPIQSAVDIFRAVFGRRLQNLIVVSAESARTEALQSIDGFVRGASAGSIEVARCAFILLSMMMAPKTLVAIDSEDFALVRSPANEPALMGQAIWQREASSAPIFLSADDEVAFRLAESAVVALIASDIKLAECRNVFNSLRVLASPAAALVLWVAVDPIVPNLQSSQIGTILFLSKCGSNDGLVSMPDA